MEWLQLKEHIMNAINRTMPEMVFDGVLDTLSTVKVPTFNFTLTVITVSTLATAMIGFLETWYWQPIWTMPILIGAFIVDLYTAIRLTGEMAGHTFVFETRKFKKWLADLVGVLLILGMLHGIPVIAHEMMEWQGANSENVKMVYNMLIGMSWTVFVSIFITQMLSAIANASKAGMIHPKIAKYISDRVDTYKPSIFDREDKSEMIK